MSITVNSDSGREELITIANFSHPTEADPGCSVAGVRGCRMFCYQRAHCLL